MRHVLRVVSHTPRPLVMDRRLVVQAVRGACGHVLLTYP